MFRLRSLFVLVAAVLVTAATAAAQSGSASLRVTVVDETAAVLPGATVLLVGNDGAEQTLQADELGLVNVTGLTPGDYTIGASFPGFKPATGTLNVKRGNNQTVLRLALASIAEEVTVETADASERRDNGFTQTLSQEEIDGLSDDPDEMADQLAQMAGPGAQIFVDGFRGGRLPPKNQIQQVRFRTNSYAAEYHDKEQLVRVYYKKLIALANKISRQKAQLQEAKKQFEVKLASANQLYREVEEMRNLLSDQIVYMNEQALEDIPQLITL